MYLSDEIRSLVEDYRLAKEDFFKLGPEHAGFEKAREECNEAARAVANTLMRNIEEEEEDDEDDDEFL